VPGHSGAVEPVEITAGRLHLRPWGARDVDAVLRAGTDPAAQRWTQVPVPYERAHAEEFAGRYVPAQWEAGGELVWAACDATTGEPLASVGLHPARPQGVREVGFWCLPEARGTGVVPDAVHAVARWAFAELGLVRLEWAAEVGNASSLRVAVKAGFAFEGRRRASLRQRDGSVRDGWWAARLPSDGPDGALPALPSPGTLTAGDLRLRPWRADDVEALEAAYGAGEPNSLPPGPPGLPADQRPRWWATERAPEQWAGGDGAPFVVLGPAGDVAASLHLMRRGRREGVAEVGVWVAPAWRRRGVATRAIEAMLDWAVPALGLSRVEWHADPANAASLALAARLGFEREGLARSAFPAEDDRPRSDSVVLARVTP
jgi:RimJ/RimL family protein N-acetyltransferase